MLDLKFHRIWHTSPANCQSPLPKSRKTSNNLQERGRERGRKGDREGERDGWRGREGGLSVEKKTDAAHLATPPEEVRVDLWRGSVMRFTSTPQLAYTNSERLESSSVTSSWSTVECVCVCVCVCVCAHVLHVHVPLVTPTVCRHDLCLERLP